MSSIASSGPARIVAAGQVTTFAGHGLLLEVDVGIPLEVELIFATDAARDGLAVELVPTPPPRIAWRLVNFDGADGRGSADPVLVAEVADDLVFLHFRVFRFGRTADRTVHYTLYLVAKAAIGWVPASPAPQ